MPRSAFCGLYDDLPPVKVQGRVVPTHGDRELGSLAQLYGRAIGKAQQALRRTRANELTFGQGSTWHQLLRNRAVETIEGPIHGLYRRALARRNPEEDRAQHEYHDTEGHRGCRQRPKRASRT